MGWDARAEGEGRGKAARGPRTSLHFTNRQEEAAGGVRRDRSLTLVRGNPNPNPSFRFLSLALILFAPLTLRLVARIFLLGSKVQTLGALLVGTSWDLAEAS